MQRHVTSSAVCSASKTALVCIGAWWAVVWTAVRHHRCRHRPRGLRGRSTRRVYVPLLLIEPQWVYWLDGLVGTSRRREPWRDAVTGADELRPRFGCRAICDSVDVDAVAVGVVTHRWLPTHVDNEKRCDVICHVITLTSWPTYRLSLYNID